MLNVPGLFLGWSTVKPGQLNQTIIRATVQLTDVEHVGNPQPTLPMDTVNRFLQFLSDRQRCVGVR